MNTCECGHLPRDHHFSGGELRNCLKCECAKYLHIPPQRKPLRHEEFEDNVCERR